MVVAFLFEKDEHVMLCLFLPQKARCSSHSELFLFLIPKLDNQFNRYR